MNLLIEPSLVLYLPLYQLDGSSFVSKDAGGRLSTVNGTLWRAGGRYFDSVSDYICPSRISNLWNSGFTFFMWVKPEDGQPAAYQYILGGRTGNARIYTYLNTNGTVYASVTDQVPTTNKCNIVTVQAVFPDGKSPWTLITWVTDSDYTDADLFINGDTVGTSKAVSGTINKSQLNTSDIETPHIGAIIQDGAVQGNKFQGTIGQIALYKRRCTPSEIRHYHQATKQRYQ